MRFRAALAIVLASTACADLIGLREPTLDSSGDAGCAQDCLGGSCDDAGACAPVALAQNQGGPTFIAQTATTLYWTNFENSSVASADKMDGGLVVLGAAPLVDYPWGIAADDTHVYVGNSGSSANTVLACTLATCTQQSILDNTGVPNSAVALNAGFLYWIAPLYDKILRAPVSGSGSPQAIATLAPGTAPTTLLMDQSSLYYTAFDGTVAVMSSDGTGTPQKYVTNAKLPFAIALDATYVYWTERGDFDTNNAPVGNGGLYRCPKAGCTTPTALQTSLADARGVVVDDKAIYYATYATGSGDGTIWRLAKPP